MDWLKLIKALVPVAVQVAETVHPLKKSGAKKLTTATTLVQVGLGVAAAAGLSLPKSALEVVGTVVDAINEHVAQANAGAGVPKVE